MPHHFRTLKELKDNFAYVSKQPVEQRQEEQLDRKEFYKADAAARTALLDQFEAFENLAQIEKNPKLLFSLSAEKKYEFLKRIIKARPFLYGRKLIQLLEFVYQNFSSIIEEIPQEKRFKLAKFEVPFKGIASSTKYELEEAYTNELLAYAKDHLKSELYPISIDEIQELINAGDKEELQYQLYCRFSARKFTLNVDALNALRKMVYDDQSDLKDWLPLIVAALAEQEANLLKNGWLEIIKFDFENSEKSEYWANEEYSDINTIVNFSHGGGYFYIMEFICGINSGHALEHDRRGIWVSPNSAGSKKKTRHDRDEFYAFRNSECYLDLPASLSGSIQIQYLAACTNQYEANIISYNHMLVEDASIELCVRASEEKTEEAKLSGADSDVASELQPTPQVPLTPPVPALPPLALSPEPEPILFPAELPPVPAPIEQAAEQLPAAAPIQQPAELPTETAPAQQPVAVAVALASAPAPLPPVVLTSPEKQPEAQAITLPKLGQKEQVLKDDLTAYINKIQKQYLHWDNTINFGHGFSCFLFIRSQAENRIANWLLAQDLVNALDAGKGVSDVLKDISKQRQTLAKKHKVFTSFVGFFTRRSIRSKDLNAAIKKASLR